MKGITRKKTDKGRRLLYLGDEDVAIVTGDTMWHSWLRHRATSRKVAGSFSDDIIGSFH